MTAESKHSFEENLTEDELFERALLEREILEEKEILQEIEEDYD